MYTQENDFIKTKKITLLTQREIEVIQLLNEGYNGPAIAQKLFVSYNTIQTHKKNIRQKLEAHSTVQLLNAAKEFIQLN